MDSRRQELIDQLKVIGLETEIDTNVRMFEVEVLADFILTREGQTNG